MFTFCYLVAIHLFPLYFPGNKLKHPSESTILKVVFKLFWVAMPPDPPIVTTHLWCSLSPSYHLTHHFTHGNTVTYQTLFVTHSHRLQIMSNCCRLVMYQTIFISHSHRLQTMSNCCIHNVSTLIHFTLAQITDHV